MVLTLLTFGDRIENHYQATFAILSYLKSPHIQHICVVTDRPQFYQYFGDKVTLVDCSDSIMQEWRGEHDFFWRIKMKAIEAAVLQHPDQHILYVDSDTFLVNSLSEINQQLNSSVSLMHTVEGKLKTLSSKTEQQMWRSLQGQTFNNITINEETEMWNAGVIALPANQAQSLVTKAIELCDALCQTKCTRRLIEQFAFSLALKHHSTLRSAEKDILHYWGNKEQWNKKIIEFFMHSELSQTNIEQDITRIHHFDYASLPIIYKEKSTKAKLIRLLNKIMPPKEIVYFSE